MQQKTSQKTWVDESGMEIPITRITTHEKLCERECARMLKRAQKLNSDLTAFKAAALDTAQKLYESFLAEYDKEQIGQGKGNMTFYNFDRSIKLEVSVNELITFDDNLIKLAKEELDSFLASSIGGTDSFIKDLILEAFATSRGRLDTKKILSLKKYLNRIKDKRYHDAMKLIDESIRHVDSKTYLRVWERDKRGEYHAIDLNFSSIQTR